MLVVENATAGAAKLSATTPDGRHTERLLTKVGTLVPTALGIVASLPPDPPAPSTESRPPQTNFAGAIEESTAAETNESATTNHDEATPQLWFGTSAGARFGAPTPIGMLDIEGHAYFEIDRWLVVASFRYGTSLGEAAVADDDSYYELVGALGVGRRLVIGPSSFDFVLSPEIASASLNDNDDEGDGEGEHVSPGVARTQARIGASACWWTNFRDESRVGVSLDSDIAPYNLFSAVRSSETEPPIPAWTVALQINVAGRIL
jgi:hypothetical protein